MRYGQPPLGRTIDPAGEIFMDLAAFIRDVPDFPKPGILFKDITPLLADPHAFTHAIDAMTIAKS